MPDESQLADLAATIKTNDLAEEILGFLEREAEADLAKSILSFRLLAERGAGVGAHSTSDFYDNARDTLKLYADSIDRLEALESLAKGVIPEEQAGCD